MTTTTETRIVKYLGEEFPNYTISKEGVVANIKTGKQLSPWNINGNLAIKVKNGNTKKTIYLSVLIYNSFIGDITAREIGYKDGNNMNVHLDNLYDKNKEDYSDKEVLKLEVNNDIVPESVQVHIKEEKQRIKLPLREVKVNTPSEPETSKYPDNEVNFARQQWNFIALTNDFNLSRDIRKSAIKSALSNGETLSEKVIREYEINHIVERQRKMKVSNLPILKGTNIVDIYKEHKDVLPFIDKDNVSELAQLYINSLISEGLIKVEYKLEDNVLKLYDVENNSISFNILIDTDNIFKTWSALIRITNLLGKDCAESFILPF